MDGLKGVTRIKSIIPSLAQVLKGDPSTTPGQFNI